MSTDSRISTVLAAKFVAPVASGDPQRRAADDGVPDRQELLLTRIAEYGGQAFGDDGSNIYAEFSTALDAIACAEAIVAGICGQPDTSVRIGISLGHVHEDNQVLDGAAVEIATALRSLAKSNEIVLAGAVREQARQRTDLSFLRVPPLPDQDLWVSAFVVSKTDDAQSGASFVQELLRRRVFRAAGGYVIGSWILVQAASIVFPEFDAPWWSMRTLIILLSAGFPLAVLLAWTVDISAKGLELTPDSSYSKSKGNLLRFSIVAVATAMSGVVLWWVWTDYIEPTTKRPTRTVLEGDPVIAVSTPRKITGPDNIDWLGEGVANLIRNDLAESRHVIVLSQARWSEIAQDIESPTELANLAKKAGVDFLIGGEYLTTLDGIVFTARIEDLGSGIEIHGARINEGDAAGVIAAAPEVSLRIKQALKIPFAKNLSRLSADFAVQNMDAYEAYIAGLGYLINFDYQLAEQSFLASLAIAPEFHIARYRLAIVMQATGRSDAALRELNSIPENAELTEREHLYIEGAKSTFIADRDPARSIEIYRELKQKYPYDLEGGQNLADAYWLDYQEDAAIAEFRHLADIHSHDPSSWMALGERLLDVGELDEAQRALRKYVEMAPGDHYAVALLGNLAQLRGEYGISKEFYEQSLALKPGFAVATLGLARSLYMGGKIGAAESRWLQLIGDTDQAAGFRIDAAFDFVGVLHGQGRFTQSTQPLNDIENIVRQETLRTALMLSTLGLAQLEIGDYDRATTLFEQAIAESPGPATRYLFARGKLELHLGHFEQLQNTVAEIRALALPADNADRTEERAASYLLGLAALEQGDLDTAADEFALVTATSGYEYAVYNLGIAKLHLANGEFRSAASVAKLAMTSRDPGNLRLDLELDRVRAMLLLAQILAHEGSAQEASAHARRFVELWKSAYEQAPELLLARTLLAPLQEP